MKINDTKIIKYFVYFLGLFSVISMVFLSHAVYVKNSEIENSIIVKTKKPRCDGSNVLVQKQVDKARLFGDRLVIVTEPIADTQQIIIVDYCTGELIAEHSLRISNEKSQRNFKNNDYNLRG